MRVLGTAQNGGTVLLYAANMTHSAVRKKDSPCTSIIYLFCGCGCRLVCMNPAEIMRASRNLGIPKIKMKRERCKDERFLVRFHHTSGTYKNAHPKPRRRGPGLPTRSFRTCVVASNERTPTTRHFDLNIHHTSLDINPLNYSTIRGRGTSILPCTAGRAAGET